jgi:hypothetical protein
MGYIVILWLLSTPLTTIILGFSNTHKYKVNIHKYATRA